MQLSISPSQARSTEAEQLPGPGARRLSACLLLEHPRRGLRTHCTQCQAVGPGQAVAHTCPTAVSECVGDE